MKTGKLRFWLVLTLLVLALTQSAAVFAADKVIPVEIRAQAYDPVGQALADRIKEEFKKDKRFEIITANDPRVVVHLSTMGTDGKDGQKLSAYSVVVAFDLPGDNYQTLVGSTVGVCNAKEVPDDAKAIVYNTSKLLENYDVLAESVQKSKK